MDRNDGTDRRAMRRAFRCNALIAGALALVLVPHVASIAGLPPMPLRENRRLADLPSFPRTIADLKQMPRRLEAFIQDHFSLRTHLIAWANIARHWAGYSGSGRIIVGKDGWMFWYEPHQFSFHSGARTPVSEANVEAWLGEFERRSAWLRDRNARFYTLVTPYKPTIYPEKLPDFVPRAERTGLDVILAAAESRGIDRIIYPRDRLLEAKRTRQVYGTYETHWNHYGAYIGYEALMQRMSADMPDLTPVPFAETNLAALPQEQGLALMLGVGTGLEEGTYRTFRSTARHDVTYLEKARGASADRVIDTDVENGRTLLLIRDSFSHGMLPLLERHFSRIVTVHYYNGIFPMHLVEKYSPDAVVLQIIEPRAEAAMLPRKKRYWETSEN
jgi:hypothetical protein